MGAGTPDHPEMSSHGTTVNRGFIVKPPSEALWVIGDQDLNCTDACNGDCNAGGCNLNPPLSNQKCVENGYMPFVGPAGWLIKASELADILGIFDSYGTWDQANKDEALSKKYFHDAGFLQSIGFEDSEIQQYYRDYWRAGKKSRKKRSKKRKRKEKNKRQKEKS